MKSFLTEFKSFAMRGNVVDLAVGIVIGASFGKIVSSLVDTIIMPLAGVFVGGVNFTGLSFSVGSVTLRYGQFVQSVVDFIIVAFAIFLVIKAMNNFKKKEEAAPHAPPEDVVLLREIRDALKK